jgi:hypothetical protein
MVSESFRLTLTLMKFYDFHAAFLGGGGGAEAFGFCFLVEK